MRQIQASEANTHLSQLLDDVERGETLIITRHGRAIARIVPEVHRRQEEIDSAIEGIIGLRKRNGKISFEELRSARAEGRNTDGRLRKKFRAAPASSNDNQRCAEASSAAGAARHRGLQHPVR